jgi:hypothetical protein
MGDAQVVEFLLEVVSPPSSLPLCHENHMNLAIPIVMDTP